MQWEFVANTDSEGVGERGQECSDGVGVWGR